MSHWDDGRLMALADGELASAGADGHLGSCGACREQLALLREERQVLRDALVGLDAPAPTARVRAAVMPHRDHDVTGGAAGLGTRARWTDGRAARASWWAGRSRLAQAALLVLLLAGGASALVLGPSLRSRLADDAPPGAAATPAAAVEGAPTEVATRVGPLEGRIAISITGLPSGAEIQVSLVEDEGAEVIAPGGTRFRTGNGRIDAEAAAGPVRVSLPRGLEGGSLRVDGTLYLTVTEGALRPEAPALQQDPSEVRFRIP